MFSHHFLCVTREEYDIIHRALGRTYHAITSEPEADHSYVLRDRLALQIEIQDEISMGANSRQHDLDVVSDEYNKLAAWADKAKQELKNAADRDWIKPRVNGIHALLNACPPLGKYDSDNE